MELLRAINIDSLVARGSDQVRIANDTDTPVDNKRKFIISTERKDSHGTILSSDGWDFADFNKAGAFYYQHLTGGSWMNDPNPDNALGPAIAKKEDKKLIGIGTFEPKEMNELAEKIKNKVDFGTMKSTSVGFLPIPDPNGSYGKWGDEKMGEDPTAFYYFGQCLKEFSVVHIPSNPDAIKKSFEANDKFMLKMIDGHKSQGFIKDFRSMILRKKELDFLI